MTSTQGKETDTGKTLRLRRIRRGIRGYIISIGITVQPVVSPFFTLLDTEIELRENTTNVLFKALNEIGPSHSLDEPDEGVTPMTKYDALQTSYEEYLVRFWRVNTQESIASLQAWYRRPRIVRIIEYMKPDEIEAYIFPEVDRKYRESVVNQRRELRRVLEWHKSHLPRCLEMSQQRVEDIKLMVDCVAMQHSRLASQLVQAFTIMTDAASNISSSKYIAPLHASQEREIEHLLIRPVVYRNFYTDGQAVQPVFGLPLSQDYLDSLSRVYNWSHWRKPLSIESMFKLEETAPEGSSIQDFISRKGEGIIENCVIPSFITIPPLMHLPAGLLTKNLDKWTRNKLAELMKTTSNLGKRHLEKVTLSTSSYLGEAALWCHNPEAASFLRAIRRKWDFKNDCPLPDGVERRQDTWEIAKLVWKKTEEEYSPP